MCPKEIEWLLWYVGVVNSIVMVYYDFKELRLCVNVNVWHREKYIYVYVNILVAHIHVYNIFVILYGCVC